MKKLLLSISAAFLLLGTASAQNTDFGERLSIGAKVGANYSNVYDSQGEEFRADGKIGFAFGGFIAIPIGKYIGFQPEVLFSQKGFKASGHILGSLYSITRTTNYIDVPLLFAFKPIPNFTFVVGPQYSYLIKEKTEFTSNIVNSAQETEFSNDNIRKNTLCITSGFDINVTNIVLGFRLGWDVQSNKGDGTSTTPRYKNMWYQGTIGFRF